MARSIHITSSAESSTNAGSPLSMSPTLFNPRFRVLRCLHDDHTSNARVCLCDQPAAPMAEPVVVKVAQPQSRPLAQDTGNIQRVMVPSTSIQLPIQLEMGRDSIHQELAVATRLLEATDEPHPHVVAYHSATTTPSFSANTVNNNSREKARIDGFANDSGSGNNRNSASDDEDELVVLVMEYCERGDLFAELELQPQRSFTEPQALSYFRQIVSGVHHLHTLGIAHRDISLENVLLDTHSHAKICDFGLSVFVDQRSRRSVVGCVGKMHYMAPEIIHGEAYDPMLADVWSLGMVLFILLTGSLLFQLAVPSDPAWGAMKRVGVAGILKHWKMDDNVSRGTVELLADLLRVDPTQRLQSLASVRQRLFVLY